METFTLNDGQKIPVIGIGTYRLMNWTAEKSVYAALKAGYRLIDTAHIYENERGVGRGIRKAIDEGIVTRGEIFVTTKMWLSDYGRGAKAIDTSLRRLGLDYIDLMILHHSQPKNDVAAYKALEDGVRRGVLRSIGLSNYATPADFDRLVSQASIPPAVLQNEVHPYHPETEMRNHIAEIGTRLEAWFPFGGKGNTRPLFSDPVIASLAAKHHKTPAQVILRWQFQSGVIAIPGSSNPAHITSNLGIFDFQLTDDDMAQISTLDRGTGFGSW